MNPETLVRMEIARHLRVPLEEVRSWSHLKSNLGLDPLDLVIIALNIEDFEECVFPVARLEGALTVRDIVRIVRAMRAGASVPGVHFPANSHTDGEGSADPQRENLQRVRDNALGAGR